MKDQTSPELPYNKNQLDALFDLYFVSHLYIFRAITCLKHVEVADEINRGK
jgi:hypothetical protein